jgi:glyoxylase-like metal-dependent hydrolase (beta-lactamase superfamily II)/rhodanese-related sulfurtransferase
VLVFRQFVDDDLGCASYLVGDASAGTALVVDPAFAIEQYLEAADELGVRIERVLETHTHADHVSGHGRFALEHGVPVAIHSVADPEYPFEPLADDDVVAVGSVGVRVVHTPGHRPEHCAFLADDELLLTGDSLFVGDAARPDLAVDARTGAEALYHSLARMAALGDDVKVYPGHVAGSLCGGNMSGERFSSIRQERAANPSLAFDDVQEFVTVAAAVKTPRPPTTERVVALNRGPWLARPDEPAEVPTADDATILDVRPFADYAAGHVPGSISVPVSGTSFATKAGFVLLPEEPVVLLAASREEALEAAHGLWKVGLLALDGYLLREDLPNGELSESLPTLGADELLRLDGDEVQVVDVREASERDEGYLPGSRNIPYRLLRKIGCDALERSRPVVTVCESGPRAAIAASLLQRDGFDVSAVSPGGIADVADETISFRRCGS